MYVTVEVQRYFETLAESGNKVPMTVPPGLQVTTEETLFRKKWSLQLEHSLLRHA